MNIAVFMALLAFMVVMVMRQIVSFVFILCVGNHSTGITLKPSWWAQFFVTTVSIVTFVTFVVFF